MSEQCSGCGFWFLLAMIVMIFIVNQYQANCIRDLQRRIATLEQEHK